jgi:hypothetical protein
MSEPPTLRTALRVTKCDPALRDERGAFAGDDWTGVSDVGSTFNGEVLTFHKYLEVEVRYLRVVAAFLAEADVEAMTVRDVESYEARWWPDDGESLSPLESVDVVREMLRERGWCRLEAPRDVYVHVGYDYYLYVGGNVSCEQTLKVAAKATLFVDEDFTSPYHVNPETGEYS